MTEQQVVIIGGSEGIGLAVAKAACTLGARVLAVSRTRESCDDYPSIPRHSRIGPLALRPAGIRHD